MVEDPFQQREVELAARDGGGGQHALGLRGEPGEAAADDLLDAFGDRQLGARIERVEVPEHLLDVERVPAGLAVQPGRQFRRRVARLDDLRDRSRVQARDGDALDEVVASQVRERRGQRVRAVDLAVAEGAEHERRLRAPEHVGEQPQRAGVGPVQVVERQHGARQPRGDRLEQPPPLTVRSVHQRRERGRSERLRERLVRRHLLLVAASVADGRATLVQDPSGLGEQPRLPDARLAGEQHRAAGGVDEAARARRRARRTARRGARWRAGVTGAPARGSVPSARAPSAVPSGGGASVRISASRRRVSRDGPTDSSRSRRVSRRTYSAIAAARSPASASRRIRRRAASSDSGSCRTSSRARRRASAGVAASSASRASRPAIRSRCSSRAAIAQSRSMPANGSPASSSSAGSRSRRSTQTSRRPTRSRSTSRWVAAAPSARRSSCSVVRRLARALGSGHVGPEALGELEAPVRARVQREPPEQLARRAARGHVDRPVAGLERQTAEEPHAQHGRTLCRADVRLTAG